MTGGAIEGLLQALVSDHSLAVLWNERSSLRVTTVFFGVALALGLVGVRSRHRPAWTDTEKSTRSGLGAVSDGLNYFVINLPGLVLIGAATLARFILSISKYAGIPIGIAAILLPFYLTQAVDAVYDAHAADLSEPIRAAFNDLGDRIGWRTLGLFTGGAVIGFGTAVARAGTSLKLLGSLAIIGGVIFFLGIIVTQLVDFANFFLPFSTLDGELSRGIGYQVFALSISSADWWTTAKSQLLLFPLYLQALTSLVLPVSLIIGAVIGGYGAARGHPLETTQKFTSLAGQALAAAPSAFLFSVLLTAAAVTIPQAFGAVNNLALSPEFVFWNAMFDALTIIVTVMVMRFILIARSQLVTKSGNPLSAIWGQIQILLIEVARFV